MIPCKISVDEVSTRILTLSLSVEIEDERWLVGHTVELIGTGCFRVVGTQLDPKQGKTVTLIRES